MTPEEEWQPVPDVDWLEVSSLGRIRTVPRIGMTLRGPRTYRSRILSASRAEGHYARLRTTFEGREVELRVHVTVAAAFLGPRPDGHYVCHNDGNKANNRADNLRYATPTANMFDAVRHRQHPMTRRTHCINGHEFSPENTGPRYDGAGRRCLTCRSLNAAARYAARSA